MSANEAPQVLMEKRSAVVLTGPLSGALPRMTDALRRAKKLP
jgi:hypothetical protein